MPLQTSCPDQETLHRYFWNDVPLPQRNQIEEHVQQCSSCSEMLREFGQGETTSIEQEDTHSRRSAAKGAASDAGGEDSAWFAPVPPRVDSLELSSTKAFEPTRGESPSHRPARLGPYRLVELLGQGGMGSVYSAVHVNLDKPVALKLLTADQFRWPDKVARFAREMKAVGRLDHPNLVRATDGGEAEGVHFLVMELVDGCDLSAVVTRHGPLPVQAACELIRQTAAGLQYIHNQGLVHRDVKPSNLMLTTNGEVKILDLGLALLAESSDSDLTTWGELMGTLAYMAPEQAADCHQVDPRSDLYSLGCTFYYLLTGQSPYARKQPTSPVQYALAHAQAPIPDVKEERPDLPGPAAKLLTACLAKKPEDRPASARDVAEVLAPFCEGAHLADLLKEPPAEEPQAEARTAEKVPRETCDVRRPNAPRRRRLAMAAVAALLLGGILCAAAVLLSLKMEDGTLYVQVDGLDASKVQIEVDKQTVAVEPMDNGKALKISVDPGPHRLVVTYEGLKISTDSNEFTMEAGGKRTIRAWYEPAGDPTTYHWPKDQPAPAIAPFSAENRALQFDGDDDYVALPMIDLEGREPVTLEAWLTPTRDPADFPESPSICGHIIGWENANDLVLASFRDAIGAAIIPERMPDAPLRVHFLKRPSHKTGQLQHVALVVRDGTRAELFIDGKMVQAETLPHAIGNRQYSPSLGAWKILDAAPARAFKGRIHEVRISNTARYDKDFNPTKRFEPDEKTLALYHFDEGEGDVLKDSSGHGHHGKIVGARWVRLDGELGVIDSTASVPWRPGPAADVLPGLVPRPAVLPGVKRWNVELKTPRAPVAGLDWSPDGSLIAFSSNEGPIRICDARSGRLRHIFLGLTRQASQAKFGPRGKRIAAVAWDGRKGTIEVWSVDRGQHEQSFQLLPGMPADFAWSRDGLRIATGKSRVEIWNVEQGSRERLFDKGGSSFGRIAWSADGGRIATLEDDDQLGIWDAASGKHLRTLTKEAIGGSFTDLAWSPDGRWLAASDANNNVQFWDAESGEKGPSFQGCSHVPHAIAFAPDGGRVAAADFTNSIHVWDVESGQELQLIDHAWYVCEIAWSPDGEQILSGALDGTAQIADADTGERERLIGWPKRLANHAANAVEWNPQGDRIAAIGPDAVVRIWNTRQSQLERSLPIKGDPAEMRFLSWSRDGRQLAVAQTEKGVAVVDFDSDQMRFVDAEIFGRPAWSPDDALLALPLAKGEGVAVARDGRIERILNRRKVGSNLISWSHAGMQLAVADESSVRIWNAAEGTLLHLLVHHTDKDTESRHVCSLVWSEDDKRLTAVLAPSEPSTPNTIMTWNVATEEPEVETDGVGGSSSHIALSPTARRCAITNPVFGTLSIYRTKDGERLLSWLPHLDGAESIAWSPDEDWLATLGSDDTLRVWKAASGDPGWFGVLVPDGETILFSAAGQLLEGDTDVLRERLVYVLEEEPGNTHQLSHAEFTAFFESGNLPSE